MTSVLKIDHVSKTFKNGVHALKGLSLTIERGRIVGLLGQNGAGKSTLIRCVLGLLRHQGQISVFGTDVRHNRELLMQDVAFISDVALLPSFLTVRELVQLTADLHPHFNQKKALDMLEEEAVPLDRVFASLSKGNKTIVHLVIVFSIEAKLWVLDEPFLGLDINRRRRFLHRLIGLIESGTSSVLISSHQLEEIESVLTDIILIDDGQCIFSDAVEAIQNRYTTLAVLQENRAAITTLPEPIMRYDQVDRSIYLFEGLDNDLVPEECKVLPTSLSDVFIALIDHRKGSR